MSQNIELNTQVLVQTEVVANNYEQSFARYQEQLESQSPNLEEVNQNKEAIGLAGREIIETFGVAPELFEDEGRSLVFTAIASRWAKNTERGADGENYEAEQVFLADTVALLAYKHSDKLDDARHLIEAQGSPISDEASQKVYDKYTDRDLSELMRKKIQDEGLLDELKERMGITVENEDPYEVRVLSINHTDHDQTYGLDAPQPEYDLPLGDPDYESAVELRGAVKSWKNGLEKRGANFASELGHDSLFAGAWVTTINGRQMLCISSALAEKILDPTEATKDSLHYSEDDQRRDLAILMHEYVHTQGGLNIDKEPAFGINLEELRAEHFSGNTMGYQDIKGFFIDFAIATGFHPVDTFDKREKGGNSAEVIGDIARQVGMARTLEVVLASPKNYIEDQSNEFSRSVYKYLGGFDGVIGRLVEDQQLAGKKEELDKRITVRAQKMAEIAGKDGNDWLWDYRRRQGLNAMTDRVNKMAEDLGLKEAA